MIFQAKISQEYILKEFYLRVCFGEGPAVSAEIKPAPARQIGTGCTARGQPRLRLPDKPDPAGRTAARAGNELKNGAERLPRAPHA
jgi:hypothetical protein